MFSSPLYSSATMYVKTVIGYGYFIPLSNLPLAIFLRMYFIKKLHQSRKFGFLLGCIFITCTCKLAEYCDWLGVRVYIYIYMYVQVFFVI